MAVNLHVQTDIDTSNAVHARLPGDAAQQIQLTLRRSTKKPGWVRPKRSQSLAREKYRGLEH